MIIDYETIDVLDDILNEIEDHILHDEGDKNDLELRAIAIKAAIDLMKRPNRITIIHRPEDPFPEIHANPWVEYELIDTKLLRDLGITDAEIDKVITEAQEWML